MLENGNNFTTYNNYDGIDEIPYAIIEWLLRNKSDVAENFWKCLYYPTDDALDQPNLTTEQKRSIINVNEPLTNNFKVFFAPLISDNMITANDMIQMRLFRYSIVPQDTYHALLLFEFDLYTNDKSSNIIRHGIHGDFPAERTDYMETCLLNLLNGRDCGFGYGNFQFNRELSTYSKSTVSINNSKAFWGRSFMLGLRYTNTDGGDCLGKER